MAERTQLSVIYDRFLSKITDDMYLELDEIDTQNMLGELFESSVSLFEFPRFDIFDYDMVLGEYEIELTKEEINILATCMVIAWLGQQLASIENTRMKYTSTDFKMTSQANHMSKILQLKQAYETENKHLQRLYRRRAKDDKGQIVSTADTIMSTSVRDNIK